MALFHITNCTSGLDMGTYEADTFRESLDVMAYDAGYSDYADARAAPSARSLPTSTRSWQTAPTSGMREIW
jgi:hypothetical protein